MEIINRYDQDFARKLQEEYDREVAIQLQNEPEEQFEKENKKTESTAPRSIDPEMSPVDPSFEYSDPNPDIRLLFLQFNVQFFWGKLSGIEVKWSPRMTLCAGLCVYEGRGGLCSVRLSQPLLKLRPRKDLVETLLHEMIHAYLFITDNNRDHDGHGPQFQMHMSRINKATGAHISIYHTFHDEVASYQQHWWRCDGPCQNRRPFFGYVKRAMNRAPSPKDFWWSGHQASCGGTFTKIKEPEGYGQKKKGGMKEDGNKPKDIRSFGNSRYVLGSASKSSAKDLHVSQIGTSKNPATIFNLNNLPPPSKFSNTTSGSSSVLSNGLLQKNSKNKESALFSNISQPSTSTSTLDDKSSASSTGVILKERKELKKWSDEEDNVFARKKNSLRSRFSKTNKKSVCEGGFHDEKGKQKKKKKKYILDELDSNDGLWDEANTTADFKSSGKSESSVSPLKVKLEDCSIKKEKDEKGFSQVVKTEKQTNINSFFSPSRSRAFLGAGYKLGGGEEGTTYLSQIRRNVGKPNNRKDGIFRNVKVKDEHGEKIEIPCLSSRGLKRPSDETIIFEISDDSENEDDEKLSKFLSKRPKLCASNISSESEADSDDKSEDKQESEVTNGQVEATPRVEVICPVCRVCLPEADINTHLDSCLQ